VEEQHRCDRKALLNAALGLPKGKVEEGPEAGRRRVSRKTKDPGWRTLVKHHVVCRDEYPEGGYPETRQGFPVEPGSLRFAEGCTIYTAHQSEAPHS
jgi:hypothetical protein